jgi:hypothetical protein
MIMQCIHILESLDYESNTKSRSILLPAKEDINAKLFKVPAVGQYHPQ